MSYEGYTEYLCDNGHYWKVRSSGKDFEGQGSQQLFCVHCRYPFAFFSVVDQTYGVKEDVPGSFEAPKIEYGWEDIPKQDHWGAKYCEKRPLFLPDVRSRRWEVAMHNLPTPEQRSYQEQRPTLQ